MHLITPHRYILRVLHFSNSILACFTAPLVYISKGTVVLCTLLYLFFNYTYKLHFFDQHFAHKPKLSVARLVSPAVFKYIFSSVSGT